MGRADRFSDYLPGFVVGQYFPSTLSDGDPSGDHSSARDPRELLAI
jgi:hypothetical protein